MYCEDFDFNTEFLTDDEVEQALDSFVALVGEAAEIDDSRTSIVNPYKMQQISYTYKVLKYLSKDMKGVKVSYDLYEPYKSMGSVSVTGKDLIFKNPEWFMKAVEFASNLEIYPKTDGTVQMNFTFHGLTTPID